MSSTTTPPTRVGGWLLLAASVAVLPFTTWGHVNWSERAFTAEAPAIDKPQHAVIFMASAAYAPISWLAQFMPREAAVIGLGSSFPESPAYQARMRQVLAERGGPHYIMFHVVTDKRANAMAEKAALARSLGLTGSEAGCGTLEWMARHLRGLKAQVDRLPASSGQLCTLALQPQYRADMAPENQAIEAQAARSAFNRSGR